MAVLVLVASEVAALAEGVLVAVALVADAQEAEALAVEDSED